MQAARVQAAHARLPPQPLRPPAPPPPTPTPPRPNADLCNIIFVPASPHPVSSAMSARDAAAAERDDAQRRLAETQARQKSRVAEQRTKVSDLERQLIDARAALMRTEAEASRLAIDTTDAAAEMEAERDGAAAALTAEKERADAADAAAARYDTKSLEAIVEYLAPKDGPARARAGALLKIKSLNALPSSEAAMNEESERNKQYGRAAVVCFDGLMLHAAGGDEQRIVILEAAVEAHLEKKSRKRPRADDEPPRPPIEPFLHSIALMWRNAKRIRDYVGARQALSLLLLPREKRTRRWTHGDIIDLVSEVRPVNEGDRVLVNRGKNSRGVGEVTARNVDGDGNVTFHIGPVDVPPRSRASCLVMTNVPADHVEHVESLICRPGEVSTPRRTRTPAHVARART